MLISGEQRFETDSCDNVQEDNFIEKNSKKAVKGKKKGLNKNVGLKASPHFPDLAVDGTQTENCIKYFENKAEDKNTSQKHSRESLHHMADEIMKQLALIVHESNLYYYTGKSYKIIKDYEALLHVILSYVSSDAFGSLMLRQFQDLFVFLKASPKLIP